MKNSMPKGQRGDVINDGDLGREQQKVHIALPVEKKKKRAEQSHILTERTKQIDIHEELLGSHLTLG